MLATELALPLKLRSYGAVQLCLLLLLLLLLSLLWLSVTQAVSIKDVEDYKEAVLSVFDKNTDGRLSRRELGLLLSIEI